MRVRVTKTAFTLLEMLVALTLMAALAAVVAPMFSDDSRLRVMAAASILASDIELAQVMTIAHPEQPVCVRFNPDKATYWLAYASAPDTPIVREDNGEIYEVMLGAGRARSAAGVSIAVANMTSNTITFAPHGGLNDFTSSPQITLTDGLRGIQLTVSANTGSVDELDLQSQPGGEVVTKSGKVATPE